MREACCYDGAMRMILGVDEAGRGPLAGPVSIGTVAIAEGIDLLALFPGLNDSKQLSEKRREQLFALLEEAASRGSVRFHVALISATDIDTDGIVPSVRRGAEEGIRMLMPDPSLGTVMLDGSLSAPREYEQETLIRGDSLIPAIMLASVAAKVTRDRLMVRIGDTYPQYGFEKHKGYGTAAHYAAIRAHGMCPEHRATFLRKLA